ncbi:hypothetical protein CTA2_9060 [Colletotrichum tanaceti]|uniref:Uncharacterized protein n=1 Tax=Colletotrichum tanaceti TaxID=1306861 RepID=A0A4U6XFL2_9PEZI|nr:hypothetical protein CTA2_9060 [Colletotrichum tanaceti]TKW54648.1 hypothetical protein CTA1_10800 [Colletotrichum tanaceti]
MLSPIYANFFDRDPVLAYFSHDHDDGQEGDHPETQQDVLQSDPSLPMDVFALMSGVPSAPPTPPPRPRPGPLGPRPDVPTPPPSP